MIFELTDDPYLFPDPHYGEPDGLIAVGGDLSIERLLVAYSNGIFPWFDYRQEQPMWWCPLQRFVIYPHEIHISHSMRTLMNKGKYYITFNKDFEEVIKRCGEGRDHCREGQEGAWLGDDVRKAYTELFRRGFASSVEVRDVNDHRLVGGLYGVTDGRCFIGESMFSDVPSASKFALIALAHRMRLEGRGGIIDCQLETPHLRSMGAKFIDYEQYMRILTRKEDIIAPE